MISESIPEVVSLSILNDQTTPFDFVVNLLEQVFGKNNHEAQLSASTAHHYGEADCGIWPAAIADVLLAEAKARIAQAGHSLVFTRSSKCGREVVGHRECVLCGRPETQVSAMYQISDRVLCDYCILRASHELSAKVTDNSFKFAHEVLAWHFEGADLTDLETSVRHFPMRARADLQLALDQVFKPNTIRQLGIKSGHRYQTVEFAELWEEGRAAQAIVPVQYIDLDIGEDKPRRCVGTSLWLLDYTGLKHCLFVSQEEGPRGDPTVRVEIAAPVGQAGADITSNYFQAIEKVVDQAQSYRGKVLSLEMQNQWQGLAGGVTVHHLPFVERDDVILPEATLALLDRNVLRFADLRERLKGFGQQAKKGLLFYGPPGTGKTHTIQYLARNLSGHTTLLVTADQVCLIQEYFYLARLLQPSVLVFEDADLIARDRGDMNSAGEEVLLNQLLNEMDGLREDSDIFFILTTNRPDKLEKALAGRPGRIDQAIEFPLPNELGRLQLAQLYKGNLAIDEAVAREIVKRTEGVSAAFMKELMRRISQCVLDEENPTPSVALSHLSAAIDEMIFGGGTLNAKLLGAH